MQKSRAIFPLILSAEIFQRKTARKISTPNTIQVAHQKLFTHTPNVSSCGVNTLKTITEIADRPSDGEQACPPELVKTTVLKIKPKFGYETVFNILIRHGKINSDQAPKNVMKKTTHLPTPKNDRHTAHQRSRSRIIIISAMAIALTATTTWLFLDPVTTAIHRHIDYIIEVSVVGVVAAVKSWIEGRH